jgi:hypothetical protein
VPVALLAAARLPRPGIDAVRMTGLATVRSSIFRRQHRNPREALLAGKEWAQAVIHPSGHSVLRMAFPHVPLRDRSGHRQMVALLPIET